MMRNQEAWNIAVGERALSALTKYVQAKGKFRDADYAYIEAQPWGQGLMEKVKQGKDGQNVDQILKDAGIKEGIWDKRISKKSLLTLLLAIPAGIITGVVAADAIIAQMR